MSITMSTPVNTPAAAAQGQAAQAQPAAAGQQPAGGAAPAAPFAQWLGRQADAGAELPLPPAPAATLPAAFAAALPAEATTAAAAAMPTAADEASPAAHGDDAGAQDNTLLAAMAMPLMPLTPMQIAQAVQSAQGGAPAAGTGGDAESKTQSAPAGIKLGAAGQDAGRRAGIALPEMAAARPTPPAAADRQSEAGVRLAVQAAGPNAGNNGAAQPDATTQDGNGTTQTTASVAAPVLAAAPTANAPAADSVKLAGPPTAWRQSLQEALGERLQVQVGKNVEQAVIRLDPPQLGRIDIAIRHSNGTLEVNISASNGEVLRQLQTVSDNLRSDLAQRQYTDVAVSVTPAPKSGAAPFGDPQQQQHRGRQPDREQDEPGRALAEANQATSAFSLGAREA